MSKLSDWIEQHREQPEHEYAVRHYSMNTDLMEREFAKAEEAGEIVICQHCGYPENPSRSLEGKSFIKYQCCFHCWYWLHNLNLIKGPRSNAVIVDGVHRTDSGMANKDSGKFLGHGGAMWYYRRIGESTIHATNNMWHQGDIPKSLNIADNAVFCTREEYEQQESKR